VPAAPDPIHAPADRRRGAGEKKMLRLVAEEADIWNCSAGN
jgi:hypothetical protein